MKKLMLALVRFYRKNIPPLTPPCCLFIPTRSVGMNRQHGGVSGEMFFL